MYFLNSQKKKNCTNLTIMRRDNPPKNIKLSIKLNIKLSIKLSIIISCLSEEVLFILLYL